MLVSNTSLTFAREDTLVVGNHRSALLWSGLLDTLPAARTVHSIDLDVTEACNLACPYCFKWQKKAVHMDEATAKAAIDWLLEASGGARDLRVNLMGGEPLVRFDLIQKIVPYAKLRARQRGKSIHFGCTTNCTLVTDEIIGFWRHYGMGFHCSIDGIPEVQNANRPFLGGSGTSDAVEKGVAKILAYRPEVMARATVTPQSVRSLLASARYLAGLGFQSMTFKVAANCAWGPADVEALRDGYEKIGTFYVDTMAGGGKLSIEEFRKGLRLLHSQEPSPRYACGAGRGVVLVDPRGDLWPCHRFGPHQCGGHFHLGRLGGVFNDRLRDVFLNYNLVEDGSPDCQGCRAAATCRSWCYAECVDATRTLYDPGANYCQAARILHDEILRVHDRLRSHHPELLRAVLREP